MTGRADSLNVAVAGSLLLYEVYRARERIQDRARSRSVGDQGRPQSW
jgi:hypothetical protein